ncbi:MAG: 50S ribosomal protein L6 [Pantoea sp. Brub]|nr:50S ribosomal protein L6 [Pantoea sp. Brub]
MSRIAKVPIIISDGVEVEIKDQKISIKGNNGKISYIVNNSVKVHYINNTLTFTPDENVVDGWAQAGTSRSIVNSMVIGVTKGFIKKLQLVGVGYRISIKDNLITLSVGYSHPISYTLPIGITGECPNQNEIILKGINKQLIGQVAAKLRAFRPPEPYKGKGIRYSDEVIRIKEAKKK